MSKSRMWWRREKLTDEALAAERAARTTRFRRTMGAVDRVLSYNAKALEIVTEPFGTPGWTDGETITLNTTGLPQLVDDEGEVSDMGLTVWLGINAHEVGHTMYTPRAGSDLHKAIDGLREQKMFPMLHKLMNLAEDQRQERLTIGRWRPWRTYLTAAATRLIVEQLVHGKNADRNQLAKDTELGDAWPLICGRTWLPPEVRAASRQEWDAEHGKGAGDRLAILIGEYQKLADPGFADAAKAIDVLTRLHQELTDQDVDPEDMPGGCLDNHNRQTGNSMDSGDMPDVGDAEDDSVPAGGDPSDKTALNAADPGDVKPKDPDAKGDQGDGDQGDQADGDGAGDGGNKADDDDSADADSGTGNAPGDEDSGSGEGGKSKGDGDGDSGKGSSDQSDAEKSGTSGAKGNSTGTGSDQSAGAGGQGGDTKSGGSPGQGAGEGEGGGAKGHGAGTGGAKVTVPKLKVSDIAPNMSRAVRTAIAHDEKVRKDLEDIRTSLQPRASRESGLGTESKDPHRAAWHSPYKTDSYMPADPETRRLARDVSNHLRLMVDAALPHWMRRVDSGKLNVRRFMNREVGDRFDDMFDRFQMGMQDEVSLDVSILLDTSSSMGLASNPVTAVGDHHMAPWGSGQQVVMHQAAQATWVIRRAVEAAEGDCTVYGFDTSGYVISPTGRRPDPDQVLVPGFGGNTDPTEVINEVWRRLPGVEAAHKVVIAVTDGQWKSGGDTMRDLTRQGVITIGVMLDPFRDEPSHVTQRTWFDHRQELAKWRETRRARNDTYIEKMGCAYTKVLADPLEMASLFDEVVSDVMTRALATGQVMAQ